MDVYAIAETLEDGAEDLLRRVVRGLAALQVGSGLRPDDEEDETRARDAISNILTALYGPEGTTSVNGAHLTNGEAYNNASILLDQALGAYAGDSEDYTRRSK